MINETKDQDGGIANTTTTTTTTTTTDTSWKNFMIGNDDNQNEIMIHIFTFLPIRTQARNRRICKRWNQLNNASIEKSPKKQFETNEELRRAVLVYCNIGGDVFIGVEHIDVRCEMDTVHFEWVKQVTQDPPTVSQRNMIRSLYGACINDWDVSIMTDFSLIFCDCEDFDEDISKWDTKNAVSMIGMFLYAWSFDQSLSAWNVENVKFMTEMFRFAYDFDRSLKGWKTLSLRKMDGMFDHAYCFNQDIEHFHTSNVDDMEYLFCNAESFNQPLNKWDTSKVESMARMFEDAVNFDQPLDRWDTSSVECMYKMFDGARVFNHPTDMWDRRGITRPEAKRLGDLRPPPPLHQ